MKKNYLNILLLLTFGILPFAGLGQIIADGLNNASTGFTVTGGTYYNLSSGTGDRPASSPFFSEGTHGYGVTNNTATLISNNINTAAYTSISLNFKLASFSITSTGNGADGTDTVKVEISPDGGTTYYSTLRVLGNSNACWAYAATGNAATAYDGNATPIDFMPAGGGNRTTDGYSNIDITNLPPVANLKIRITLKNNDVNERWIIDNFTLQGIFAGKTTIADGNWNNAAIWSPSGVPASNENTLLAHAVACTSSVVRDAGTTTTITTGASLSTSATYNNNGTTTVNGTFQLNTGGFANGNNFIYGTSGSLNFNSSINYGVDNSVVYWPVSQGPFNVNVIQGGITLNTADRTVAGTCTIGNASITGIFLNTSALTLNGIT